MMTSPSFERTGADGNHILASHSGKAAGEDCLSPSRIVT
jgi:hypothetical protein